MQQNTSSESNLSDKKLQSDHDELIAEEEIKQRIILAHRIVQLGVILSLVWKWSFFIQANDVYNYFQLQDPFFPEMMRSAELLRITYLLVVGTCLLNLFSSSNSLRIACGLILFCGLTILCTHQASYNDMTFVTAWWANLWSLWLSTRINQDNAKTLIRKAALLSRLIISVILLGGAAGKWTSEYWSGSVLYDIYFIDRDYWVFNFLRDSFETESLQTIAMWYSRQVIVVETVAGFLLWTLPARWAAWIGMMIMTCIALSSNFLLFSVVSCLIALASVGLMVPRVAPRTR